MRKLFSIAIAMGLLFIACQQTSYQIVDPTADEIKTYSKEGGAIAKELVGTLQQELQAAIQEGGITNAIEVCNLKAIPLTEIVERNTGRNVSVKRISSKFRNPANEPVDAELDAIKAFETLIANGEPIPEFMVQKVIEVNGEEVINFYKPMKMGAVCLNCHGDQGAMTPDVLNQLKEYYPEDKATGYQVDDFRGLIKVSFLDD